MCVCVCVLGVGARNYTFSLTLAEVANYFIVSSMLYITFTVCVNWLKSPYRLSHYKEWTHLSIFYRLGEDSGQDFHYRNVDTYGTKATIHLKLVNPEYFVWVREGNLSSNLFYHLQYFRLHLRYKKHLNLASLLYNSPKENVTLFNSKCCNSVFKTIRT